MARFSEMTPIQATSEIIANKHEQEERRITLEQYEYYKEVKAWEMPTGTYERAMWETFKESVEYKKYIIKD